MFAAILGLVGVGGVAAIALRFVGFAGIKTFAQGVPRWVWYVIGGIALAVGLFFLHQHFVHKFRDKVTTDVNNAWHKKLDAEHAAALAWKRKFDQSQAAMAQQIRNRHEETLRSNAALADSLLLHGPGAARCGQGDHSSAGAGAGGHFSRPGQADASGPAVPADDRAAVPWPWLVGHAQQCDANLSEVKSWREWEKQLRATWPK